MLLVLFCIHVNRLCTLYLYSFLAVVYRGPHGRLAFFLLNVLPSENKDYYYYYLFSNGNQILVYPSTYTASRRRYKLQS